MPANLVTQRFLLFMVGLLLTWFLTPGVIRLARRVGAVDRPGERKAHAHEIPRVGGAAIVFSFLLTKALALGLDSHFRFDHEEDLSFWVALSAGSIAVFLLGLYDDLRYAPYWAKFCVQFAAAFGVIYVGGVRVDHLTNPFGGEFHLGWFTVPFTALWIVGVTNAFNLIDGLDGLAGGVALISTLTIFVIALLSEQSLGIVLVLASLAGTLTGFLRYNFHPARVFLGDCGSMFIGFQLAVLSMIGASKRTTALAILIPMMVVGVPVFDTLYTMGRRLGKAVLVDGELKPSALLAMFRADRGHIHHTLMEMGYTHRRAVVILHGLAALLAALALVAVILANDKVSFTLLLFGAAAFVLMKKYGRFLALVGEPPKRILLVDDDPAILLGLKGCLAMPGYEVDTADSLAAARRLMERNEYAVIFSDNMLTKGQGGEGLELLAFVQERNLPTRVVLFTGYGSPELEKRALELGAAGYFEKPVSGEALRAFVAKG